MTDHILHEESRQDLLMAIECADVALETFSTPNGHKAALLTFGPHLDQANVDYLRDCFYQYGEEINREREYEGADVSGGIHAALQNRKKG